MLALWLSAHARMTNAEGLRAGHLLTPVWLFQRSDQGAWSSWPQLNKPPGDRLQSSDLSCVRARESGLPKRLLT